MAPGSNSPQESQGSQQLTPQQVAVQNAIVALSVAEDNVKAAAIYLHGAGPGFQNTWREWYEIIGDMSVTIIKLKAMLPKLQPKEEAPSPSPSNEQQKKRKTLEPKKR